MNCKSGDLAICVNAPPWAIEFIGRIYRVKQLIRFNNFPSFWTMYEGDLRTKGGQMANGIEDKYLKPIRPVNYDAIDEMNLLAGIPPKFTDKEIAAAKLLRKKAVTR